MIPDEVISEVLERTDIVAVVGRHVDLRKRGASFWGLCPFHTEKTPSFTVTPVRRGYKCFGCGEYGNAIDFLMEVEGRTFPEAVRELAAACGVEVPETGPGDPAARAEQQRKRDLRRRLLDVQDRLTTWYSEQLHGPTGAVARRYLEARGVTREAAEAFRLGWASPDKRAFERFVQAAGIDREDLVTLGVLIKPDGGYGAGPLGGAYLRFRGRLMFPVVDVRGEVVGYSGRLLDPEAKAAKYLNSPETPVFTKGEHLYGAHTARHAARRAGRVVLCEGNVDVIALWQAGLQGSVAAMGTALTPVQVRLVKRLDENVVCVMDGDAAGTKAAFESLVPFLEAGVQPRAVMLPDGDDPDSYLRARGAAALETLIGEARPLLDLFLERAAAEHPADPPGRAAALRAVAPALQRLGDELALPQYRSHTAQLLGVPVELVDRAIGQAAAPPAPPRRREEPAPEAPPAFVEEPPPWLHDLVDSEVPAGLDAGDGPPLAGTRAAPPAAPLEVPRYERELFEFIMLFPRISARLCDDGVHECLTHDGLAGFVARLCREVREKPSPNLDRLLRDETDVRVRAFLWACRARGPSLDEGQLDNAYRQAVWKVMSGYYRRELERVTREGLAERDPVRRETASRRLQELQARLRDLNQSFAEGAN